MEDVLPKKKPQLFAFQSMKSISKKSFIMAIKSIYFLLKNDTKINKLNISNEKYFISPFDLFLIQFFQLVQPFRPDCSCQLQKTISRATKSFWQHQFQI